MTPMSPFRSLSTTIMIISVLMALASTNWLMIWASMELNLLSFIPLMLQSKTNVETEGAVKYFLSQALGSALLLLSSVSMWNHLHALPIELILIASLMLKLGSAPCHFWYPSVMSSLSWLAALILSTWQKLAPLALLVYSVPADQHSNTMLMLAAGSNALIGGIMGLNQSHMRTMLAYSSIGHMGWMLALTTSSPNMSILYFVLYCMIVSPIFMILNSSNTTKSPQFLTTNLTSHKYQMLIPLLLMSLAGLPPLTGFIPKWLSIMILISNNQLILLMLLIGSFMNLYFYLQVTFSAMLATTHMNHQTKLSKLHSSTKIMSFTTLSTLGGIMLFI